MKHDNAPFFVGYLNPPKRLRVFLLLVGVVLVASMALFGLLLGSAQDDPGTGAFRFD